MSQELDIHTIVSQPFQENSYIVRMSDRQDVIVVDPGMEPDLILDYVRDRELDVVAILNTHGHGDHIAGNESLKDAFPNAPLVIGENEARLLTDAMANLTALFGQPIVSPPADRLVREWEIIEYAGTKWEIREIPGHSPGSIIYVHQGEQRVVLGGDVLFRGSVGRTDFPGGSWPQLLSGIKSKLLVLPQDFVIYPGHGPVTTVGNEMRTNPYLDE